MRLPQATTGAELHGVVIDSLKGQLRIAHDELASLTNEHKLLERAVHERRDGSHSSHDHSHLVHKYTLLQQQQKQLLKTQAAHAAKQVRSTGQMTHPKKAGGNHFGFRMGEACLGRQELVPAQLRLMQQQLASSELRCDELTAKYWAGHDAIHAAFKHQAPPTDSVRLAPI